MEQKKKCVRCDGCGQIANDEEGTPWTAWLELPLKSSAAVLCGLVEPVECPDCKGTGEVKNMQPAHKAGE